MGFSMRGGMTGSNTSPLALEQLMGYSLEMRATCPGILALAVALAVPLSAIWAVPWFVTQDGPAHVYNAQILVQSFDPESSSRSLYSISWKPIPNWMGHLVLAGLLTQLPAWIADRSMTSMTLVGLAAATLWLRWRVCGSKGLVLAALLSALLAMNMAWLLGFTSFLIGSCLFPITLGIWWRGRYRLSFGRIAALALLLCLGYFCHLVSLGLTVVGLIVLAVTGPVPGGNGESWRARTTRLLRTSISFVPLLLLGYFYLQAAKRSGPLGPVWENLWGARLGWVDPITLAVKDGLPLTSWRSQGFILFAPAMWLSVGLALWWYGRITGRPDTGAGRLRDNRNDRDSTGTENPQDERRGWLVLAALFLVGGIAGPDSFGPAHGEFLPQRVLLLGFIALVPVFDADLSRWSGRFVFAAITLAVVLQAAIVWDYALYCNATAGQIIRAGKLIGRKQRIATLLVSSRGRFRANPLLHAENWLGVDTGNVVWNNYEARHYYFPVQFRPEIERPDSGDLESISIHDDPNDPKAKAARLRDWEELLDRHAKSIDVVLFWKSDPELEAITRRWFNLAQQTGDVRIFKRTRAAF
jgi:hypothetical protein